MAERRMFTQKITESDAFLEMPLSAQALYFHLCMNADDDGFVKNPKRINKMLGGSEDDFKLLIAKSFIIIYETGVIVVKHWRMHNLLRMDRYKPTEYEEEKSMLFLKENGAYTLDEKQGQLLNLTHLATKWQPNGNQMAPKDSIGKDSIDNKNIYSAAISEIVGHLNAVCHTNYHSKTAETVRHITARLNEGYTVDDFKTVIDKKHAEWVGTEYEKFLRPNTLFAGKFESYLNQQTTKVVKPDEYEGQKYGDDDFF